MCNIKPVIKIKELELAYSLCSSCRQSMRFEAENFKRSSVLCKQGHYLSTLCEFDRKGMVDIPKSKRTGSTIII